MADDKSKPKKDSKAPPKKGSPPEQAGPPPGADDPMATGMGVQPPMPGQGMDPYAALAGQISNISPVGQPGMGGGFGGGGPMGGGPPGGAMGGPGDNINGLMPGGGGMGGGMGMGAGGGQMLQGGPPGMDPIQHALMSQASPMAFPPDIGQTWADPVEDMQGNMSINQILELLSFLQGGIPASGADPMRRPGSATAGLVPPGLGGGGMM